MAHCCDHLKNACLTDCLMPLLVSNRPNLHLMGELRPNLPPPLFHLPPTPLFQEPPSDNKRLRGSVGSQEQGKRASCTHLARIDKRKNEE